MSGGKLPEGWVNTTIGDISVKCSQRVPDENEQFIYVDIGSINRELKVIENPQYLIGKDAPSRARKEIKAHDIIVSLTRPNLNAVALVSEKYDEQIASTGFEVIRPTLVESRYIFALVRSRHFIDSISGLVQGALYPAAKSSDVQSYEFPLPPPAEQKIITEKLDTLLAQVDSTKARLEQIPQILKHFRQATLTMAIKGDLTKNWRVENNIINAWTNQKASDLCIKVQSGSTPTGNPFEQNGKIPFLKVYNIVNQKIDFDYKPQFITDEVHRSKSKRSIAFPDDILMNIVGPPLGKIAILTDQYPEWNLNQAITLFRVDKEKLSSKFLYYVLCEGKLVRDVMHDTKGIVGQINISLTQCREAIIPCPSRLEQHEIVRRVEQLFAYADTIEKQVNNALTRVNSLTQSILAKAFRGELTAQWRAENPDLISGENSAAALLEKIKAERAASGGKKASRKKA
ncbi:TPA: restriction endonuclease subunit S [Raoultella planticola]|uniref:Type I restriction enzyme EcoKI specificity protein n=1 Tax=Raoultella planticola TaxID=575 RepID=A0A485ARU4_RAOPL|nr:restriction endonuclease subunit S [Raoultella planticola]ELT9609293.1 restriction endonuclease subunit S [Raoultella planticola]KFD13677.1 type I restriction-modification system, specificity subunit S [Raoultella planticola ATCC 33531]VFS62663.1 Type I restriction enzyme EcoKI specificity protein [Raoultella planticola]HAT1630212.1 restriction endonuclease subunit S [Raoultella planticola]